MCASVEVRRIDVSRRANWHVDHRVWPGTSRGGALLAVAATSCLAPHYSVDEQLGASSSGGAAGSSSLGESGGTPAGGAAFSTGGALGAAGDQTSGGATTLAATGGAGPLKLRYCDSVTLGEGAASAAPDWSCVTSTRNNSQDTPGVILEGSFLAMSGNTVLDRLDYCSISFAACDDTLSTLQQFRFTSSQQGCGIIYWHEGDSEYSATMWHTITRAASLSIGTIPLVNSTVVRALASALQMPITADGAALIGIKDCSKNPAAGVMFAAQTSATAPAMGLHFSIQGNFSIPQSTPTGVSGLGGVANLTPGALTIYGYVGDGCIVAEARIVSEASRIAYVYLVPNGYR